jgi:hypothetical protein
MPRLRRSDKSVSGLRRVSRGRGFQYLTAEGGRVTAPTWTGSGRW